MTDYKNILNKPEYDFIFKIILQFIKKSLCSIKLIIFSKIVMNINKRFDKI